MFFQSSLSVNKNEYIYLKKMDMVIDEMPTHYIQVESSWTDTIPIDVLNILYSNLDDGDLYCFLITCKTLLSYLSVTEFASYLFKIDTSNISENMVVELFCRFCRFDKMDYMKYIIEDSYLQTLVKIRDEKSIFFDHFVNQRRQALDLYDDKHSEVCDILKCYIGEENIWRYNMQIKASTFSYENIKFNKGDYYNRGRKVFTSNMLSSTRSKEEIYELLESGAIPTSSDLKIFLRKRMDKDRVLLMAKKFQLNISSFIYLFGRDFLRENISKYGISVDTFKYIIKEKLTELLELDTYLIGHPRRYIDILLKTKPIDVYATKRFIDFIDGDYRCIFLRLYNSFEFELSLYMLQSYEDKIDLEGLKSNCIVSKNLFENYLSEDNLSQNTVSFDKYVIQNDLEYLQENKDYLISLFRKPGKRFCHYSEEKLIYLLSLRLKLYHNFYKNSPFEMRIKTECYKRNRNFLEYLIEERLLENEARFTIMKEWPQFIANLEDDLHRKFFFSKLKIDNKIFLFYPYDKDKRTDTNYQYDDRSAKYLLDEMDKFITIDSNDQQKLYVELFLSPIVLEHLIFTSNDTLDIFLHILSNRVNLYGDHNYTKVLNIAIQLRNYDVVNKLLEYDVLPNSDSYFLADDIIFDSLHIERSNDSKW